MVGFYWLWEPQVEMGIVRLLLCNSGRGRGGRAYIICSVRNSDKVELIWRHCHLFLTLEINTIDAGSLLCPIFDSAGIDASMMNVNVVVVIVIVIIIIIIIIIVTVIILKWQQFSQFSTQYRSQCPSTSHSLSCQTLSNYKACIQYCCFLH